MDRNFLFTIDYIFKIVENKKEKLKRIRKLEDDIFNNGNLYLALRLAFEEDHHGFSTKRVENFIAKSNNANYIYRFAYNISGANIKKLQEAVIKTNDIIEIARFGCFIEGTDKHKIGDIVASSNNGKAAYLYMCFVRTYPYINFRNIILKSKKPRYLYQLARLTQDDNDLKIIQEMILNSKSLMYVRMFAKYIKNADIKKLEEKIIRSKNIRELRLFVQEVPMAERARMMLLLA